MNNQDEEYETIDIEKVGTKGHVMHYQAYGKEPPKKMVKIDANLPKDSNQPTTSQIINIE